MLARLTINARHFSPKCRDRLAPWLSSRCEVSNAEIGKNELLIITGSKL